MSTLANSDVERAIEELRAGRIVVVIGTPDRRGEGTLTIAAEHCTDEAVTAMTRHGRGIVSLCLTEERCEELGLRQMTTVNTSPYGAAFTISIEAREGVSTGISAADRARTVAVAIDPATTPRDLVSPGHIFPLRARRGGVLAREAHTEAAVDLARLAGTMPAAVICGMLDADGDMAGEAESRAIAAELDLAVVTVADLVAHRRARDPWTTLGATRRLATSAGELDATVVTETYTGLAHLAFTNGRVARDRSVAVHAECPAGDVVAAECGCGAELRASLDAVAAGSLSALVYMAAPPSAERLAGVVAGTCRGEPSAKAAALGAEVLERLAAAVD